MLNDKYFAIVIDHVNSEKYTLTWVNYYDLQTYSTISNFLSNHDPTIQFYGNSSISHDTKGLQYIFPRKFFSLKSTRKIHFTFEKLNNFPYITFIWIVNYETRIQKENFPPRKKKTIIVIRDNWIKKEVHGRRIYTCSVLPYWNRST